MDKLNKPIFRTNEDTGNCCVTCPHCDIVLAKGYYRGMTITLFKECPNCAKPLEWDTKNESNN